jgi:hypothetical protein
MLVPVARLPQTTCVSRSLGSFFVAAALVAIGCAPAQLPVGARSTFASSLAAAFDRHDAGAVAALFTPGAEVELVGDARPCHGRAAIESAFRDVFAFYAGAHLSLGRVWVGDSATVVELAFSGSRGGHDVGVVGAAVVALDSDGLARTSRIYLDVPTLVGQVDRSRLPDGASIRAAVAAPPGGGITVLHHTATETANLAAADRIWASLDAHDAAGTLAPSSDDYVYDDFSGPGSLDKPATERMVARFLGMVPDFVIVSRPTFFAAGDDVITESVEHMTARGRPIVLHGLDVKRFANGRVTREWQYANGAEALSRLLGITL